MQSFELGIIKVFTMMMSHCQQSKVLWNGPMIGEHIANAQASPQTYKNTQIKISEISKDTKQRFKGKIQETSG